MKGLRDLNYEDRLKALKLQSLEKRRIRKDLVLTDKTIYNQTDLEATQLFKLSRRPGQGSLSLDFFNKPGEPDDEETVLHADLFSTGTVYHLQ